MRYCICQVNLLGISWLDLFLLQPYVQLDWLNYRSRNGVIQQSWASMVAPWVSLSPCSWVVKRWSLMFSWENSSLMPCY